MHYNYVWHAKSIYTTKFQVFTVANIEVIRHNVLSHARVLVIGVSSNLKRTYIISFYSILKKTNFGFLLLMTP